MAVFSTLFPLLLIVGINIYYEKYNTSSFIILLSLLAICYCSYTFEGMGILFCLPAFDYATKKNLPGILITFLCEWFLLNHFTDYNYLLFITISCTLFSYSLSLAAKKEIAIKESYDHERSLRYELEQSKIKLMNYAKEAARLAETQERNRMAREIHDNVGHRTVGVLIQIQAAQKLFSINDDRAMQALDISIKTLSETVDILRDTVHNIKPHGGHGVDYIKTIINNFNYCPINFNFTGDFSMLSPNYLEILGTNIMEALTNAARYSKATNIDIFLDIGNNFTHLCVKDNGIGCNKIKIGLGLSGMRERVENAGGNLTINSDYGFSIVSILPATHKKGGVLFENNHSR